MRRGLIPMMRLVNAYTRERISEMPGCAFIDIHSPMLDPTGMPNASLYREDGLHMNASGYALWRDILHHHAALFR